MGAVLLSSFKKYYRYEGEAEQVILVSPSTMDSADTVDITELLDGRTLVDLSGWDTTTGDTSTATIDIATDIITVDAGGGTTEHVYALKVDMIRL